MAGESKVFSFQCEACGAPIPVHAPGLSLSFVCTSCQTVVHEDSKGAKILIGGQNYHYKPLFQLGEKVTFRGTKWQILGFMVRSNLEGDYQWREYLLFNPREGYHYLMEADGHWNWMHQVRHRPKVDSTKSSAQWGRRSYKVFYRGFAKVVYVLGEFHWRVKVDDEVKVCDYVNHEEVLSSEFAEDEEVWTIGTYVPRDDIQKAFLSVMQGSLPDVSGIAPNQPSPYRNLASLWLITGMYFVLILVLQLVFFRGSNQQILDQNLDRDYSLVKQSLRTDSFTVDDDDENIEVKLSVPLNNTWAIVSGTMVPEANQDQAFSFERELAYYTWIDDEGSGSEGDTTQTLFFPHMKKGPYHIEFDIERDPALSPNLNINSATIGNVLAVEVRKDVGVYTGFWFATLLLLGFPIIRAFQSMRFETKRLENSNVLESA